MPNKTTIFIDGSYGTTGIGIAEKVKPLPNFSLITLERGASKDLSKKKEVLQNCDIAVLCLPDNAANETAMLIEQLPSEKRPKILDASTAHRTNPNWTYGFAELPNMKNKIAKASCVSNPGCYAIAFISIMRPLIENKILHPCFPYVTFGASGYSGGGKTLIEKVANGFLPLHSLYATNLQHKHLPEMQQHSKLQNPPIFQPLVVNQYSGMVLSIALPHCSFIKNKWCYKKDNELAGSNKSKLNWDDEKEESAENIIFECLQSYYKKTTPQRITVKKLAAEQHFENGYFPFPKMENSNAMQIHVAGNKKDVMVHATLCNLGIGASGNALHNLTIMSGNL